jgi:hypothetical protein
MNTKEQIIELSWEVKDLLSQYVVIHDGIFKTSIRHIIPIPGIFKAIDFGAYFAKAENIILELENCDNKIKSLPDNFEGQEREYLDLLSRYTSALIETVIRLKIVLGALYAKSQSFANSSYNWSNYKNDLANYDKSVEGYLAIGGCLNELFQKIKKI